MPMALNQINFLEKTMSRITVLGMGAMGSRMAMSLITILLVSLDYIFKLHKRSTVEINEQLTVIPRSDKI